MSVFFCIPSARPDGGTIQRWAEMHYSLCIFRDTSGDAEKDAWEAGKLTYAWLAAGAPRVEIVHGVYPGYAKCVNALIKRAMELDADMSFAVCAGDDTIPDLAHSPEEIAEQLIEHFGGTFSVTQFTGDRWGDDEYGRRHWPDAPAFVDRIAGSPWIGREFARRMYGGNGPYWDGWHHNWLDEELKLVAEELGVYWPRRDLIHYHDHPLRNPGGHRPEFHRGVDEDSRKMKPVFEARQAAGFPGSEPIP